MASLLGLGQSEEIRHGYLLAHKRLTTLALEVAIGNLEPFAMSK
jgi:hypothetical protein